MASRRWTLAISEVHLALWIGTKANENHLGLRSNWVLNALLDSINREAFVSTPPLSIAILNSRSHHSMY